MSLFVSSLCSYLFASNTIRFFFRSKKVNTSTNIEVFKASKSVLVPMQGTGTVENQTR